MMNIDLELLRRIKQLYHDGLTKDELRAMGFKGTLVYKAIEQYERSKRLPDEKTPSKRCKQCGHKSYEPCFVNGVCQGCHTRKIVNEQWKGRFRV
ncbi:hypothetical protein [Pirellula sp. SH-Sr6A]|uniref:hypothetical protein n=1 Tax=Pirellula sp. SH-Sr6A TaxID=1632865 RepID=UPI0011BA709B|nr:hypothetical protein [Pirellula sp. SH-Sr6A]